MTQKTKEITELGGRLTMTEKKHKVKLDYTRDQVKILVTNNSHHSLSPLTPRDVDKIESGKKIVTKTLEEVQEEEKRRLKKRD